MHISKLEPGNSKSTNSGRRGGGSKNLNLSTFHFSWNARNTSASNQNRNSPSLLSVLVNSWWYIHFSTDKVPSKDIYTWDTGPFFFTLSGAWVAMGWRTEDKSGLFFLTGNSQTEQHWSSLIHYPPLNLAHPWATIHLHLELSLGLITHLNSQRTHMHALPQNKVLTVQD